MKNGITIEDLYRDNVMSQEYIDRFNRERAEGSSMQKKETAISAFIKECMGQLGKDKMLEIDDIIAELNIDYERFGFKEGFMCAFDLWADYIRSK